MASDRRVTICLLSSYDDYWIEIALKWPAPTSVRSVPSCVHWLCTIGEYVIGHQWAPVSDRHCHIAYSALNYEILHFRVSAISSIWHAWCNKIFKKFQILKTAGTTLEVEWTNSWSAIELAKYMKTIILGTVSTNYSHGHESLDKHRSLTMTTFMDLWKHGSLNVQRECDFLTRQGAMFKTKRREGELCKLAKATCFLTRKREDKLIERAKAPW